MIRITLICLYTACFYSPHVLANCNQIITTVDSQPVNLPQAANPVFSYQLTGATHCGSFVDGSKWVAGANISITSISGNGGAIGADFDPVGTDKQGFFAADYGNYDASENITTNLPYNVDTSQDVVLVSAIKRTISASCGTRSITTEGCIEAYDFLTFLSSAPPTNAIRPSFIKAAPKTIATFDQAIDMSVLPEISQFSHASESELLAVAGRWRHVAEIGGKHSEGGRAFRPHAVVANYASTRSLSLYEDLATILASTTATDARKAAIASYFVYSRDIYYAWVNPQTRSWLDGITTSIPSGAGQSTSNVTPANVFGALGGTVEDKVIIRGMSEMREISYQEQQQINPGPNGPVWGDSCGDFTENIRRHWAGVADSSCSQNYDSECNPNDSAGKRTCRDPHGLIDGPERANYGLSYIGVTKGPYRDWCTITRAIPAVRALFNYEDLCIYVDRVIGAGYKTAPDSCAGPEQDQQGVGCSPFFVLDWTQSVTGDGGWQQQCCSKNSDPTSCETNTTFGVNWGPVHGNLDQCIQGSGRYTSLDGVQISTLNGTSVWGNVYEYFRDNPNTDDVDSVAPPEPPSTDQNSDLMVIPLRDQGPVVIPL